MRRLLKWIVVTIGLAALVRWIRRRGTDSEVTEEEEPAADPADELRRKLAESRADEPDAAADAAEKSVEDRRTEAHEQGRAALDEMKSSDED